MFIVEWFYCPDGIIPDSVLTGLNNIYIYIYIYSWGSFNELRDLLKNYFQKFFCFFFCECKLSCVWNWFVKKYAYLAKIFLLRLFKMYANHLVLSLNIDSSLNYWMICRRRMFYTEKMFKMGRTSVCHNKPRAVHTVCGHNGAKSRTSWQSFKKKKKNFKTI